MRARRAAGSDAIGGFVGLFFLIQHPRSTSNPEAILDWKFCCASTLHTCMSYCIARLPSALESPIVET